MEVKVSLVQMWLGIGSTEKVRSSGCFSTLVRKERNAMISWPVLSVKVEFLS